MKQGFGYKGYEKENSTRFHIERIFCVFKQCFLLRYLAWSVEGPIRSG